MTIEFKFKFGLIVLVCILLSACERDLVSHAHRETEEFLSQEPSNIEIVDFLNSYSGEASSAWRYEVFVSWGISNSDRFVKIMNHPKITKRILDITLYKISDMGQSATYCRIYALRNKTDNEKHIRESLLGCEY